MRSVRFVLSIVMATLFASGCASTRMTSMRDPESSGKRYSSVLVVGSLQDLGYRKQIEQEVVKKLKDLGVSGTSSMEVALPGKQVTTEEFQKIIEQHRIDCVLIMGNTDSGSTSFWVPQSSYTRGTATVQGNTVQGSSTTKTYGGFYGSKPWANFDAKIYDVSSGTLVWTATARSGGNAYANTADLINSFARKTVETAKEDGILDAQ